MYKLKRVKNHYSDFDYECLQGNDKIDYVDVVYDTRKIVQDSLFVCLKGLNHNTHHHILEIVEKGAKIIVIEEDLSVNVPDSICVIKVQSTRRALAYLSADKFNYVHKQLTVIGVTGTKGKTTTTHFIKHGLEQLGYQVGMIGTNGAWIKQDHIALNNTTPESYILHELFSKMVSENCTHVVLEISSQSVKLERIAGISFDIGIFLNISEDHIGVGEHENFEEYLACKVKFFEQCRKILVNTDDSYSDAILSKYDKTKIFTFSIKKQADYSVHQIEYIKNENFVGLSFELNQTMFNIGMLGEFNVYNASVALATLMLLNENVSQLSDILKTASVDGRMETVYTNSQFSIIVDYAHNAVSMENLLMTLKVYRPNRLVVLFGAGGNRSKDRRFGMGEVAGKYGDFVILTEDNSRFENTEDIMNDIESTLSQYMSNYVKISDRKEAIRYAIAQAKQGDLIVIAGRGHEQYLETNGSKRYFKDKEVTLSLLNEK